MSQKYIIYWVVNLVKFCIYNLIFELINVWNMLNADGMVLCSKVCWLR